MLPADNRRFNTQPPEGGWEEKMLMLGPVLVSTHSRPKAAGSSIFEIPAVRDRFNTQPPEGGWGTRHRPAQCFIGFNTQPPEGGWIILIEPYVLAMVSTHSRPKAAGKCDDVVAFEKGFQHTAARRRLA